MRVVPLGIQFEIPEKPINTKIKGDSLLKHVIVSREPRFTSRKSALESFLSRVYAYMAR